MELKELTEKTLELFCVQDPEQLGPALLEACGKPEKLRAFRDLVGGDLSIDWLQKIWQYYLADRKDKKQDYTPASIAEFMGMLAGSADRIVDMCAGSGALIIQKWKQMIMYLNDEENRYLAEFRDALLPELMNGNLGF